MTSGDRLKRAASLFYEVRTRKTSSRERVLVCSTPPLTGRLARLPQARLDRHQALHDVLQVFVSGAIDDGTAPDAGALLNVRVEGVGPRNCSVSLTPCCRRTSWHSA